MRFSIEVLCRLVRSMIRTALLCFDEGFYLGASVMAKHLESLCHAHGWKRTARWAAALSHAAEDIYKEIVEEETR